MPRLVQSAVSPGSLAGQRQPVLEPGDLVLRPWRASDASSVVAAYGEPDIQQWHARSMTEAEAQAWIHAWRERWALESGAGWAIAGASGLLGQISLRSIHLMDGIAEVSFWVLPGARGRGVAAHALCTLSVWVFDELGLHRIELNHSTLNPASCRVAEKAGYALEGIKRREALHPDGWHDMHLHARLADDPRPAVRAVAVNRR